MRILFAAMLAAGLALSGGSFAQGAPDPFSHAPKQDPFEQTKLVAFNYSENETYPVIARSGMNTVIAVPSGEVIQGVYLSDKTSWDLRVAGDKRHVFVKPHSGGLFNTATMITDKHTYLLAMTSNTSGLWYQKVHWVMPSDDGSGGSFESYDKSAAGGDDGFGSSGAPNFEYDISGKADFRPVSVYDNGKFTRFVMPKALQELPALFSLNAEGLPEVVNYTIQGNALQVNRLMHGALLKLGNEEVRVYNRAMRPVEKRWYNFSGWGD